MTDDERYQQMWEIFKSLKESALIMNHYDLAENTAIKDSQLWKEFLMDADVSEWRKSEFALLQEAELKKMLQGIGKSNSVGKAQLINVLSKLTETNAIKDGPMFIYTYVPLSPQQAQADNVIILNKDPFLKGDL